MSLLRLNTTPSCRDLRVFSALWLLFLGVAGVMAWRRGATEIAEALWAVAAAGGATGLIFPGAMRYVYLASVYAAFPIGWAMSHLILGAVYYLVLTPMGLIMRLLRHDPLARRFDPHAKTYWRKREAAREPESYFRQH